MNEPLDRVGRGRWLGALALVMAFLGGLGAACVEDDFPVGGERPVPGGASFDGGGGALGADAELSLCPPAPPKPGENCPSTEETALRCSFTVGVCSFQGSEYDITLDLCCSRGVVWDICGTNTTPCDRETDAGI